MAYSVKRRRISNDDEQDSPANAPVGPMTHGHQEVAALSQEDQRTPPKIDEIHARVRRYQASKRSHDVLEAHNLHRAMHRRQTGETGAATDSSLTTPAPTPTPTTTPQPIISVSVVVGGDGSLTPITWTFPGTAPVELPSTPTAVVPVTEVAITTEHEPSTTPSSSSSSSSASSSSSSSSAETPSLTVTDTPAPAPSDQSTLVPTPTSDSPQGMIGMTPTAVATYTATTTLSPLPTDVTVSAASTNATTITDSASLTSSLASLTALPSDLSASINTTLTDSIAASTSSAGTITSSASTSTSSSDLLGLFGIIVTTLPDGRLSTVPASRLTSLTTLPNGQLSTSAGSLVPVTSGSLRPTATDSPGPSGTGADATSSPTGAGSGSSNGNGNGNGQAGTAGGASSGDSGSSSSSESQGDSSTPPPQILAGGIVGGVAGIAAILLVAFVLLRWYRRKSSMQRLDNDPSDGAGNRGMAERKGLLPLGAAAGLLRGRRDKSEASSGERGFQRVSGRKLPSAFSGGITGPTSPGPTSPPIVPMPAAFENGSQNHNRNNGGSGGDRSFYRDSTGYYGGVGIESGSSGSSPGELGPAEIQPGPARQPTLHPGGPYSASTNPFDTPPGSPRMPMLEGRSATPVNLGASYPERSATPHSHHSRFTEEV
ncbi:hypothetical protein BDZ85DRAFT_99486 [Elsinoe ampelina]|uniref:Uncharacterized protein n=1 Tax=Elsinoe ampelina TaxID=302913 RepID=A0A6A6GEX9_9PEZI|nr:hypothetical protein BDZ85DRAFT_99486 [Elsinoe ampelina]